MTIRWRFVTFIVALVVAVLGAQGYLVAVRYPDAVLGEATVAPSVSMPATAARWALDYRVARGTLTPDRLLELTLQHTHVGDPEARTRAPCAPREHLIAIAIDAGVDMSAPLHRDGSNALDIAARYMDSCALRFLIAKGAAFSPRGETGHSTLDLMRVASRNKSLPAHEEIVESLRVLESAAEAVLDTTRDADGNLVILDSEKNWKYFVENVDADIAYEREVRMRPADDGSSSINFWRVAFKDLRTAGYENPERRIAYVIEARRAAGLPELAGD